MGSSGGNRTPIDRELSRTDSEYKPLIDNYNPDRSSSERLRRELEDRFRGPQNAGGGNGPIDPSAGGGMSSGLGPSGGSTGGRTGMSSYGGDVSFNNSQLGDSGSARGTFEDFSKTGGVDATGLRNRATAQIPAFFEQFKAGAQRRANTQGGYSPGFDAQQADMARSAGREGFNASRQVEGDIADKIQSGRALGAQGLMGLGNMETDNNQFNSQGQFGAAEGNANRRQGASQFDRGFDEDTRRYDQDFGESRRRYDTEGLEGLYDRDRDSFERDRDSYSRSIGDRSRNSLDLINSRREPTSRFSSIAGGLSGLGSSLLGGGLLGGGSRRRPTGPWESGGGG